MSLLSFVEREDDSRDIIELVSCQWNGENCSDIRQEINRLLRSARKSRINKEYRKAIDEIVEAYFLTEQNTKDDCQQCLEFFRETMLNSLSLITAELKKMTTGFFRDKRYQEVYLFAAEKTDELAKHHQSKKSGS
ncbi:MAG: hypothetical protein AB2L24_24535 [Mangrovibacterium sp.]|jgi:hypothetical protein